MRITNSTILRGYNRNLDRLQNARNKSENRILTGRQFNRASESPLNAAKALVVRKSLYESSQYKENLDVASKFYDEAETSLLRVSEELANIRETIIAAVNTTKDPGTDLQIYAQQLETKAHELCSIFNTDTAERMIFGGESDDPMPFEIKDGMALYHGIPLNACTDPTKFPYSNPVYIDIGLGMVQNQETQEIDPQSALDISFNGAQVTGCGTKSSRLDINVDKLDPANRYMLDVYVGGEKRTVSFEGTLADFKTQLEKEYNNVDDLAFEITSEGVVTAKNTKTDEEIPVVAMNNERVNQLKTLKELTFTNEYGYTDNFKFDLDKLDNLTAGTKYSLKVKAGEVEHTISFEATGDATTTIDAVNAELNTAFAGASDIPQVNAKGEFRCEGARVYVEPLQTRTDVIDPATGKPKDEYNIMEVEREFTYSNNYIQLTLDVAKALRNGDIDYANSCIDRIVDATENLLIEIADLGCNEDYIDFMTTRFDTRELNLKDRQKALEATDLESEITMLKTYEALYNAALQMSSSVVPNSIFNFIN